MSCRHCLGVHTIPLSLEPSADGCPCSCHLIKQPTDSTLSKECFIANTDAECFLCSKSDCTHYCHSDSYKLWRATDDLIALILLVDIRRILRGDQDIIKQYPILQKAAREVGDIMTKIRSKNHGIINWEPNDELPTD